MPKSKKQNQTIFHMMDTKTIFFIFICAGLSVLMNYLGRTSGLVDMFGLIQDPQYILIFASIVSFLIQFMISLPFFFLGLGFGLRPLYLSGSLAFFLVPFVWILHRTFFAIWTTYPIIDWGAHAHNYEWGIFISVNYFIFSVLGPFILVTIAFKKPNRDVLKSLIKALAVLWGLVSLYEVGLDYIPFGEFNSWFDVYVIFTIILSKFFWAINMLLCFFVAQWLVVKLKWNIRQPISLISR